MYLCVTYVSKKHKKKIKKLSSIAFFPDQERGGKEGNLPAKLAIIEDLYFTLTW